MESAQPHTQRCSAASTPSISTFFFPQRQRRRRHFNSNDHARRRFFAVCSSNAASRGAVLLLPGFLSGAKPYLGLADSLTCRGFAAKVVPISSKDWAQVLLGSDFQWYLRQIDAALLPMYDKYGKVVLVGHSAGGWVARLLLGDIPYQGIVYGRRELVRSLVSLGTPHHSIEAYPFGRVAETLRAPSGVELPAAALGSSLQFTNHVYPRGDSFPGVQVVCLAGNAIAGEKPPWRSAEVSPQSGSAATAAAAFPYSAPKFSKSDAWLAYESYKSGCGQGEVEGDGVTPLKIAHLPGAENVVLPSVWHGPGSRPGRPWYGDAEVVERWVDKLESGSAPP